VTFYTLKLRRDCNFLVVSDPVRSKTAHVILMPPPARGILRP
jgi:hypothetical protein